VARAATPPAAAPPPLTERHGPSLAIAVLVLAIAVGGAAVAIVLSRGGTSNVRLANVTTAQTVTAAQTVTTVSTTPAEATTNEPGTSSVPASTAPSSIADLSSSQMQSGIQQLLLSWHEDVVNGDYRGAWQLMSARKRAQDEREYGYSVWVQNQSTLRPYLDPSGLRVTVQHAEASSGVAQVDVSGMRWSKPGASCSEWSGITWVKYEDGAWRYDPGYSTTPQREREWKPRFSELLGGRC
jgi:hypothetical protein